MKHTHKTREEEKICALWFGECWHNPPKTDKTKKLISNKPHATYPKNIKFT